MPYCIGSQVRTSTVLHRSNLHSLHPVNNGTIEQEGTYSILVHTAIIISYANPGDQDV